MDMNTRTKNTLSAELVYIGGIGFMFEVNQSLKHNLISPDVLTYFDGVQESGEITKDCAFPLNKPNTNLLQSIFKYIGEDWVTCSDNVYRKCLKINCSALCYNQSSMMTFYIDESITEQGINGFIYLP